jgi:hypothetical protein
MKSYINIQSDVYFWWHQGCGLYDMIETYIKDAQNANKSDLVEIWQTIKKDRQKRMHMLKEALEKEIQGKP